MNIYSLERKIYLLLRIAIAITAIAMPVFISIYIAREQAIDGESRRALGYARDVMNRSEMTADQIERGVDILLKADKSNPCSEKNLKIMSALDLSSSYIQALGYVRNNEVVCSSLKYTGGPLILNAVDYVSTQGIRVRMNVSFPFVPNTNFTVVEKSGYAAILNKDLLIDATAEENDSSLGLFNLKIREFISHRGEIRKEWIPKQQKPSEITFQNGNFIVAVVFSQRYEFGAIAALPMKYVEQKTAEFSKIIVPLGIAISIFIAIMISIWTYKQRSLPSAILAGLKHKEFFIEYQPVIELKSGKWIGAEVLVRWRRNNGKIIRPDLFIPIAEANGLITNITVYVLKMLAEEATDFFIRHPGFHIGINFSAMDLECKRSLEQLNSSAKKMRAKNGNLVVEATERGLLNKPITRAIIHNLRRSGIEIAVDDFGTGYSSLSYLSSFELDYLKIDKSFVDALGTDAVTSDVVNCIIGMAKSLQLRMIAEGVETQVQANYLMDRGVQYAQGWLFAKSMSLQELEERLTSNS